ncbi:MAG: helix-hairpin-helix domain-containing protein [Cyanobacteria bacterium]|nr:helix-hairpin-helix domain-containing protein [Cyanobacteriota bacterium]
MTMQYSQAELDRHALSLFYIQEKPMGNHLYWIDGITPEMRVSFMGHLDPIAEAGGERILCLFENEAVLYPTNKVIFTTRALYFWHLATQKKCKLPYSEIESSCFIQTKIEEDPQHSLNPLADLVEDLLLPLGETLGIPFNHHYQNVLQIRTTHIPPMYTLQANGLTTDQIHFLSHFLKGASELYQCQRTTNRIQDKTWLLKHIYTQKTMGPYPLEVLKDLIHTGKIQPSQYQSQHPFTEEWIRLDQFSTFHDLPDLLEPATSISPTMQQIAVKTMKPVPLGPKLDLNQASLEELLGVSVITNKEAAEKIHAHQQAQGFQNLEEVGHLLQLQPHQLKQLAQVACVLKQARIAPKKIRRLEDA